MQALKRLDDQARQLESTANGPSLEAFVATEPAASPELDGRSVFGWERDLQKPIAEVGCRQRFSDLVRIFV